MHNWQKWTAATLLIVLIACTTFAAGFGIGRYISPTAPSPVAPTTQVQQKQFQVFWEALNIIEKEFYAEKPLDYQAMTYGAIRGMVASLGDPHTMFLTPAEKGMLQQDLEGEFGGIGVTIQITKDGYLQAVKIFSGAPAEVAGLRAGDVILEVDGKSVKGMDMAEAIGLIRGPKGTQVRLLVQRGAERPFEVTVTRAIISVPTIEYHMLDSGVAYLALREFNSKATESVRKALDTLLHNNPRGLVLDLRGNPGGYLHIADEVASEFLENGLLILTERTRAGAETRHLVRLRGRATQIPLVVLVDRGSASASEIVAGAIQDNKRGILIGEKTFGKGSVQITEELSDKSGLQVTIRRWYTPNDHQIDGQGLTPDIVVEVTEEDLQAGRDPQLERAVSYLLSQGS
jgi:carboxyl-terminal processing protease